MSASPAQNPTWCGFARLAIERALRKQGGNAPPVPAGADQPHNGAFVTLHERRQLRACMGTLNAELTRAAAVEQAAISAALHDPRFAPLTLSELPDVQIEVSILTPPHRMRSLDELVLGRHGVIVSTRGHRGLFLPQVATEHKLDKETLLSRCCNEKAGLPADAWRDPATVVELFECEIYVEEP